MMLRRFGWAVAGLTMAASGGYVFVYLYRWEWNRALMSSALFLAAEIGIVAMLVGRRLSAIERRLDQQAMSERRRIYDRLRAAEPPARVRFDWLARPDQMNVFVPVLLGAGVILSGLAWVVERLARATAGRAADHHAAGELSRVRLPAHGFLDTGNDPYLALRGPVTRRS